MAGDQKQGGGDVPQYIKMAAIRRQPTGRPQMAQPVHEPALRPRGGIRGPLVAKRELMDETVRETLGVAQLPFIDKVVDILVGAETDLEHFFRQTCVSHVRRGSLRGSSSGFVEYVQPALNMEHVAPARSSCAD